MMAKSLREGIEYDAVATARHSYREGSWFRVVGQFHQATEPDRVRMALEHVIQPESAMGIDSEVIQQQAERVAASFQVYQTDLAGLQQMIADFQRACPHKAEVPVMMKDPDDSRRTVLRHHVCLSCRKIRPRPVGLSYQICDQCGSQMKFDHLIPGQGERTHVYACTACKHQESHT